MNDDALDWRSLARDVVLAGGEDAARWDQQMFIEAAHDILLAPEEWRRYAAEIEGCEPQAAPVPTELLARRVYQRGLADLDAGELVVVLSSASAFRAVTGALRQRLVELETSRAGSFSPAQDDSLPYARVLLERAVGGEGSRRRHLDFSVVELAKIAGHPRVWQCWRDHLGPCARCRELYRAAVALRLGGSAVARDGAGGPDDEVRRLHIGCLAVWCLSAATVEETVRRWLSIGETALREDSLWAIVDTLRRGQSDRTAQQRISSFICRHAECSGRPEDEWIAVIGRFEPCSELDPADWDEGLACRLPDWFGKALLTSLYLNRNHSWETRVQRWPAGQPWQSRDYAETYVDYIGWLSAFRGD